MYNRKAFKQEAKQFMRSSVPHFMLVALVYVLLTTGLSEAVTWLTGDGELLSGVVSIFLNVLVWLFSMVMAVGFAHYALCLSRREETGMGSLFQGFSYAGRSIGVELLSALFTGLWGLLISVAFLIAAAVLITVAATLDSDVWITLALILCAGLYLAALILFLFVSLRYAMAPFALADNPEAGAMDAIRRSVRMLRGYKRKYFVLWLSFLGWELLAALITGIILGIGFTLSGAGLIVADIVDLAGSLSTADDLWMLDRITDLLEDLAGRLNLWLLLAGVISLPLTLWLDVYRKTASARFYNYVCGYDYHQYMNRQTAAPDAPFQEPPRSARPEEPQKSDAEAPRSYYTSILPPEPPGEEGKEPDGEEEE